MNENSSVISKITHEWVSPYPMLKFKSLSFNIFMVLSRRLASPTEVNTREH